MNSTLSNVRVRAKSQFYVIGNSFEQLTGIKLPSNQQVLRSLFYAKLTLKEVFVFLEKARIPCQLQKNTARTSEKFNIADKMSRGIYFAFISKLPDLLDVAVENAFSKMTNQENIEFLIHQRNKECSGHMEGVDLKVALAEERREARSKSRITAMSIDITKKC